MATKTVRCIYEGGYLKPLDSFALHGTFSVEIVEKPKMKELLREGYEASADESKRISEELFAAESDAPSW